MLLAPILGAGAQSLTVAAGRCQTDDEVPAAERELYERPALRFAETLLGDKPTEAYTQLSDRLANEVSLDRFLGFINQTVRPMRPFARLHVEHSYRLTQVALGNGRSNVVCTAVAHGGIGSPEGRVAIAHVPVPLQAHVIIEGKTRNNRWAFVLWLLPDQPSWRIAGFHAVPVTVLERTATDLWKQARQVQQAGHAFNACMLYVLAEQLAFRGPNLQLGIHPEIQSELSALKRPPELAGQPPFEWKFAGVTYLDRLLLSPDKKPEEIVLSKR